ncbi:fasciclin-like arabinogalactan protein 9 [Rhodamnia argentea]|uniref:Fasciclin-like arabinogalactan protein 9 n=1 Tax=Rhodamnia argentea TaxID=178133 RepID=A0A8B8MZV4_9MYRT|nr:fasciclin-like arabinogalactan protein 9 [Rhodamnia argentea]
MPTKSQHPHPPVYIPPLPKAFTLTIPLPGTLRTTPMASSSSSSSALSLVLIACIFSLTLSPPPALAQSASAPAPSSSGPANLTGILQKNGQYTYFIRLLTATQVATQIENQLNTSTEGITVFAPTDNAFNNLKAAAINDLSNEQQVQLVLYHVAPKYYTLQSLLSVSNPVRTQGNFAGLNFSSQGNQVNVSTGIVETQINNALYEQSPLAVYQVDKVLLPPELFGAPAPASSTSPTPKSSSGGGSNSTKSAKAPSSASSNSGASGRNSAWLGFAVGVGMVCMGFLS